LNEKLPKILPAAPKTAKFLTAGPKKKQNFSRATRKFAPTISAPKIWLVWCTLYKNKN
jgi:hypothetical protein